MEDFTIQAIDKNGEIQTWTRNDRNSAIGLADTIQRKMGLQATVTITGTDWIEYETKNPVPQVL